MRKSIIRGIGLAARSWKMLLLMLSASALAALPAATPAFNLLRTTTRNSFFAARMLADRGDVIWFADYVNGRLSSSPPMDARTTLLLGLFGLAITWLLQIFWSGGIVHSYVRESNRFSMAEFFRGGASYYWPFLKLAAITGIGYAIVALGFVIVFALITVASENAAEEFPGVLWEWIAILICITIAFVLSLLSDYAKIAVVAGERRKAIPAIGQGVLFATRNLARVAGLAAAVSVAGLSLFLLMHWVRVSIVQSTQLRVLIGTLAGQLAIACLIWKRLALYGAEIDLFCQRSPVPSAPEPLPEPVPAEAPEPPAEVLSVE